MYYGKVVRSFYSEPCLIQEDLCDTESFAQNTWPHLCKFLGVNSTSKMKLLRETVKQADPEEDLSTVIDNYEELE